jgi:hypothetical protein
MDVMGNYETVVVGGGTAGVMAAIAAARQGINTLLVEKRHFLGGMAATGMSIGGLFDENYRQVIKGIPQEIAERAARLKGGRGHVEYLFNERWISSTLSIDPECFKKIAFNMLKESGCEMLLDTVLCDVATNGNKVGGVEVVNVSGRGLILANTIVDATGNGDVAAYAGTDWKQGSEGSGISQPVTSIFRISNVDIAKLESYMNKKANITTEERWGILNANGRGDLERWLPWSREEAERENLPLLFGVYYHGNEGDLFINATHVECNPLDGLDLSRATVKLREQVNKIFEFLKQKVPGFDSAYLSNIYETGIRESRRIVGDYVLTEEDIKKKRHFEDTVAKGAYPIDVHKTQGAVDMDRRTNVEYEIPYRCLLPKGIDNLLVAGRCVSSTFKAQAAIRGMGPCMATGQAAGIAAALSVKEGVCPRKLEISKLQEKLREESVLV